MRVVAGTCAGVGAVVAILVAAPAVQGQTPTITVGGVGYAQYGYQLHKDSVTNSHLNAFDITRAYINVVGKFPLGVGVRITPDIYRNADGSLSFRLKYAYATWTPENSPLTLKMGAIHTPWLDWEEALWDYRMQGTMALERFHGPSTAGYLSSSDLGAGVDGKFKLDFVNFQLGVYDGETYNKPEGDQHKDLEARLSVRLLESNDHSRVGGLRVTGYGAVGKPTGGGVRDRYIGMVSYKSTLFTLAGEYARVRDRIENPPTGTPTVPNNVDGDIWSFFGVLNIPNTKVGVIGRVDIQNPNTDLTNNKQTRYIAGVSYQLSPQLRALADVDNLTFESGTYTNAVQSTRTQALFQIQFVF